MTYSILFKHCVATQRLSINYLKNLENYYFILYTDFIRIAWKITEIFCSANMAINHFFSSPHTTYFIMHSSFYASWLKLPFLIQWQWLIEQYRFFSLLITHTHTTNSKELWILKLNHCCFSPLCSLWQIIFLLTLYASIAYHLNWINIFYNFFFWSLTFSTIYGSFTIVSRFILFPSIFWCEKVNFLYYNVITRNN